MSKRRPRSVSARKRSALHAAIETGYVHPTQISRAVEKAQIDLVLDPLTQDRVGKVADEIARDLFPDYGTLFREHITALGDIRDRSQNADAFNRLEGASWALERRLVLAAYFLGVQCGRNNGGVLGGDR